MNQSLDVTNIKKESSNLASSDHEKILTEMQVKTVKQESDYLIQSEICIKPEPQEDECEFPVTVGTCYKMYPNMGIKVETEEPLIKIESKDLIDESMQDPLDVSSEIKDEKYFSIDLDHGKPKNKTEPTEEDKNETFLETNKDDSHWDRLNQGQGQQFVKNESKNKKYVCNVCNMKFTLKCNFDVHLHIHTGQTLFTCGICKKSFNTIGNLDTHILIHSGEKQYVCHVCKIVFKCKSDLNEHRLTHSGKKPFSCKDCDKSFTTKQSLVIHKRIHTGDKPYVCDVCNKAFTHKSHRTEHRRLHTGEKSYSCDICNKSFAQKPGLNQHKRIHKH